MKDNRNAFIIFIAFLCAVMFFLYTTERYNEPISVPDRKIDYSADSSVTFDVFNIFKKDQVAEIAYEIFEFQGIRTGIVNVETTGFTKEDLGVDDNVINYTEVVLDDGTRVTYVEPETEAVNMYNKITNEGLLVVIVEGKDGVKNIIREGDANFELYKSALLKEKRSIQNDMLTNLELLLSEATYVGAYVAYLGQDQNMIRTSKIYYNEKKNYMLMLSKDKIGVEYFMLDAGVDLTFDHTYEFGTEFLEVKGFVTSNELEHLLYRSFLKMIDLDTVYFETKFKGEKLFIERDEGITYEE